MRSRRWLYNTAQTLHIPSDARRTFQKDERAYKYYKWWMTENYIFGEKFKILRREALAYWGSLMNNSRGKESRREEWLTTHNDLEGGKRDFRCPARSKHLFVQQEKGNHGVENSFTHSADKTHPSIVNNKQRIKYKATSRVSAFQSFCWCSFPTVPNNKSAFKGQCQVAFVFISPLRFTLYVSWAFGWCTVLSGQAAQVIALYNGGYTPSVSLQIVFGQGRNGAKKKEEKWESKLTIKPIWCIQTVHDLIGINTECE